MKIPITEHLQSFEAEFERYFPEPKEKEAAFIQNPFSTGLDQLQDQFCDLQNDSSARDAFQEIAISQFWCAMHESYPQISELTIRTLLPFAIAYLGESGFSALAQIKKKTRNRMKVDDDIRLALTNTKSQISKLVAKSAVALIEVKLSSGLKFNIF